MKSTKFLRIFTPLAGLLCTLAGTAQARVGTADCATCHRGVYDEWRASLHAQAWTSPLFTAELEKRSATGETACDCHAPASVAGTAPGSVPTARTESLHSGVDCLSCHMDSSQTIWSSGEQIYVPHFTRQESAHATAAVCSGCHTVARDNRSVCQDCHMPDAAGPAASGIHLERKPGAVHRSHLFAGSRDPAIVASGLSLKVLSTGGEVRIELANLVDAHQVPVSRHHHLVVALNADNGGQPIWSERVTLDAGGRADLAASVSGATQVELRFYPGPAVWPDSFYVIQREYLNR